MVTKTILAVPLVVVLMAGCFGSSQESTEAGRASAEQQIQQLIGGQVKAWNAGDLEGFMAGYWNSPELTFFSNDSETEGWQPTLDRYKGRYRGEGHAMGTLDFADLQVQVLAGDAALVRGRWHLKMPDGKEPRGMFTLVLRRFPNLGWKIVHDHSSGA